MRNPLGASNYRHNEPCNHKQLRGALDSIGLSWPALYHDAATRWKVSGRPRGFEPALRLSEHFGHNLTFWRAHRTDRITTLADSWLAVGLKSRSLTGAFSANQRKRPKPDELPIISPMRALLRGRTCHSSIRT